MRPNPCLPSDTIVACASLFIAGPPPASSPGRGRGFQSVLACFALAELFMWCAGGCGSFVFLWMGEEVPPAYPPPSGRGNLSNPPKSEGRWGGWVCCLRMPSHSRRRGEWKCFHSWCSQAFYRGRKEKIKRLLSSGPCNTEMQHVSRDLFFFLSF